MAEPYRFGGPIPEQVKRLASRRAYRGSQLFATLKKNRRQDFLENPGSYWEKVRDDMGAVVDVRPKLAINAPRAECSACAEVTLIERDAPIRVCTLGERCKSAQAGREPSPVVGTPAAGPSDSGPSGFPS